MDEGWDPMAEDYRNKSFNSYDRGPGKNLPQDPNERKQSTTLFIRGIPGALTEQGVRNIFGKFGEVRSCRVRQTPNYSTNIAFIVMANVAQCSDAIQHINGSKIHNDTLHVSFAKSKEDKDRDRYVTQAQDEVIKSHGGGRTVMSLDGETCNGSLRISVPNSNVDDGNREIGNLPSSSGVSAQSRGGGGLSCGNRNIGRHGSESNGMPQQGGGDGVTSDYPARPPYQGPPRGGRRSFDRSPSGNSGDSSRSGGYSSDGSRNNGPALKACEQCGKPESPFKCGNCTVLYCSPECQTRNWGSHKSICGLATQSRSQVFKSNEQRPLAPNGSHSSTKFSLSGSMGSQPVSSLNVKPMKTESPVQQQTATAEPERHSATSITLPPNEPLKVKLVEFQSPARFYVQLADNADLLRLKCTMRQQCKPYTSEYLHPQPGDLLAVQLANGTWHRGLVIAYKFDQYFVYLVDIGQKHFTRVVCPIPAQLLGIPFQAVECSLFGLIPYKGGSWTDFAVQISTKLGVTTGEMYTVVCVDTTIGNQVMFTLNDGSDLGDKLVEATAALVDPNSKYKVRDSLHRYLNVGDSAELIVEPSSIEGVEGFYAQITSDALQPYIISFTEMESHMSEYAQNIIANSQQDLNRKPSPDDFVLCPFDGSWSRAEVYQCKDMNAAVGFIDYGNLHLANVDELIPLPRIFSHLPAIAAKVNIDTIADSADLSVKEKSVEKVKELLRPGTKVAATVKDLSWDTLSVDILMSNGESVGSSLLAAGLAVSHKQPLEDSLVSSRLSTKQLNAAAPPPEITSQSNTKLVSPASSRTVTPPATHQPKEITPPHQQSPPHRSHLQSPPQYQQKKNVVISPSKPKPAQDTSLRVTVKPLLDVGKVYTVGLHKLDGTDKFSVSFPTDLSRSLETISRQLDAFYSRPGSANVVKPAVADFVVFEHLPNEWRRGYVLKVSTPKKMALTQHLDFEGESTKVSFENIRPMLPRFAEFPCQAHPLCKLKGVATPEEKNLTLKPYMQLAVQLQICEYKQDQGVYIVNVSYEGESLKALPVRKKYMAGKDVPFAALSPEPFKANVVEVNSPLDLHITPAILEDIQECLTTVASQGAAVKGEAPLTSVEPGEVVLLFCTEFGEWDRAIILQNLPGKQVSVKSADFGAVYAEPLDNTRALTEPAAKVPLRAIKCGLAGVGSYPTEDACNYCKKFKECTVTVEVVGRTDEVVMCTIIADGDNVNESVKRLMTADRCAAVKGEPNTTQQAVAAVPSLSLSSPPAPAPSPTSSEEDQRHARLENLVVSLLQEVVALRAEKAKLQAQNANTLP